MMRKELDKDRIKQGVGGQAVIEGIMLRSKDDYVVAVRRPDKSITFIKDKVGGNVNTLSKIIFIRGIVNLFNMLKMGYSTLVYSANASLNEGDKKEEITPLGMTLTMATSLIFAVGLFIILPYVVAGFFGIDEKTSPILFNFLRGFVKLFIFFIYLCFMHLFKDIKRVFQYHGAEHMIVNAYEHGETPDKENIKKYTTLHPRCGTTFMFLVLSVSIVLYVFTSYFVFNVIYQNGAPGQVIGKLTVVICNILLLPIVAGISYEVLKLGFRFYNFPLMRLVILPGILLQKITTSKPNDEEIEVALFALDKLLDKNITRVTESDNMTEVAQKGESDVSVS